MVDERIREASPHSPVLERERGMRRWKPSAAGGASRTSRSGRWAVELLLATAVLFCAECRRNRKEPLITTVEHVPVKVWLYRDGFDQDVDSGGMTGRFRCKMTFKQVEDQLDTLKGKTQNDTFWLFTDVGYIRENSNRISEVETRLVPAESIR